MALSCIVFDCDGTILESLDAENAAFAESATRLIRPTPALFFVTVPAPGGKTLLN